MAENSLTIKERLQNFMKNRWLYCIAFIFNFIVPIVFIGVKAFSIQTQSLKPSVSVSFGGMVAGLVYLAFVAKKVKAKVEEMEQGAVKIFVKGIHGIIPFVVAAFVFFVIEKALDGASVIMWAVIASLLLGLIFQVIDWEVNKDYLYAREIDKLAKKQADIEVRKEQLIEQARQRREGEAL